MALDEDHQAQGFRHTCVACAGEACVSFKAQAVRKQGRGTVSDRVPGSKSPPEWTGRPDPRYWREFCAVSDSAGANS